jgi:hypothetical protein
MHGGVLHVWVHLGQSTQGVWLVVTQANCPYCCKLTCSWYQECAVMIASVEMFFERPSERARCIEIKQFISDHVLTLDMVSSRFCINNKSEWNKMEHSLVCCVIFKYNFWNYPAKETISLMFFSFVSVSLVFSHVGNWGFLMICIKRINISYISSRKSWMIFCSFLCVCFITLFLDPLIFNYKLEFCCWICDCWLTSWAYGDIPGQSKEAECRAGKS